ncbi:helix-turn-helix domain-containing protein [Streptococcus pneumoniae]|uniref:helix-turn-helix domain-containing protein n=1 Tax=Streptococcus pneumoniae TaxID=1313 RepID=UPI00077AA670|nr:helix-turn-helix domain-containing protein [Streptococcus pneumoniae]
MYLGDLMEKAECGQFSILSFLLQESQTTVKAVMEETGFSKATLTKYVTLLNDKALDSGLELAIHSEDENLRLSIGAATKGRDIRNLFLDSAVKYQILVYLLYHQQFLAHQLAQELVISEATLGRHLAGLNQILSEFDLSIQNGRWRGPEHQIRYFYFCLFRKVWSSQEWEGHMQKPERKQEIANLEEICGASLSAGQKLDLVLWAHISQQRLRVNACQFQVIEEKMRGYFDNIFYLRLLRKVPSFFAGQHIPLGVEDGEMMIFFSFLLSHRILPLHTMEYILGFGGQLVDLLMEHDFKETAEEIFHALPAFQQGTDLDKKILWEWLQLIEYMAENGGQHMRIGLDLTSGFLVFSRMAAILKRYLEYNRFITIEAYDPSRHYDLLVTNNPIHKKEQTPVYYLKNDLDMEDLAGIRQLLFT